MARPIELKKLVRAAGVVLWRSGPHGPELVVIHRPKYDDWTFPKGKLEPGERHREAAVREAREETGYRVELGPRLPTTRYAVRGDRVKRVRYWAAVRISGGFTPGREVDELRWLPVDEARDLLSYDHDRELVDAVRKFLPERF